MKNIMLTSELSYWGRKGERDRGGGRKQIKERRKLNNNGDITYHFSQGYYVLSMR